MHVRATYTYSHGDYPSLPVRTRSRINLDSTSTYYPNQFYEQTGSTVTKYYFPSAGSGQASPARELPCGRAAHYTTYILIT